jgi:UDP-N-acetylglucosamine 2-epimerase (non-hydrolysing)
LQKARPLILSVVGTRPEAIKMAPVASAIERSASFDQRILLTGQHRDLADLFPQGIAIDSLDLDLAEHSAGETCERVHYGVAEHLIRRPASLLLVQGDTSSALGGALGAAETGTLLGHVEAGLRSGDPLQPWPEEENRVRIDRCSQLLFAPTAEAADNLHRDPLVCGDIQITGNSGIDALLAARRPLAAARRERRKTLLVTCHRRENRNAALERIASALKHMVRELPVRIVLPLHPNPHVRSGIERLLKDEPHIGLVEPLDFADMVALMERSWAILTDSGGLQEEAPALGKPVLVLREVTERPEAIACGNAELVGTDTGRILDAVALLLRDKAKYRRMSRPSFPFGDGRASERIASAISVYLTARSMLSLRTLA